MADLSPRALADLADALAAAAGPAVPDAQTRREEWHAQPCAGCGRLVCFRPQQRRNTCGWCGTRARRSRGT